MKQVRQSDWKGASPQTLSTADLAEVTRRRLLDACEWLDMPGLSIDRAAWTAYRAALLAAPTQEGWPDKVDWPTPPPLPAALARRP